MEETAERGIRRVALLSGQLFFFVGFGFKVLM
jgi:hypothetical protein